MKSEILIGSFSVLNALLANKRRIIKVLIAENLVKTPKINQIIQVSQDKSVALETKSSKYMDKFANDLHHQGIICLASPLSLESLRGFTSINDQGEYCGMLNSNLNLDFKKKSRAPLWIGLEEIVDPRNLGAIIRSCYYFGVDGIITTSRNSAPINATVSKSSAGAVELMQLYTSFNLSKFLRVSKENGWNIFGTNLSASSTDIREFKSLGGNGSILVFGNEGEGLSGSISKICNQHLMIKGDQMNPELVDSLNVGVSAGILMYEFISRI